MKPSLFALANRADIALHNQLIATVKIIHQYHGWVNFGKFRKLLRLSAGGHHERYDNPPPALRPDPSHCHR